MAAERQEQQYEERLGGGPIAASIPVDITKFIEYFMRPAESVKVYPSEKDMSQESRLLVFIDRSAAELKRVFMQKGNLVLNISSKEAFLNDYKRKIALVYALSIEHVKAARVQLEESLQELQHAMERRSQEEALKAIASVDESLRKILLAPLIVLKLIDDLSGIMQVNLPVDLMSNFIKAHLGVVTS